MSTKKDAASVEEISNWIRTAAAAEPGLAVGELEGLSKQSHAARIQAAIARARRKTYVPVMKPFRGLFRNQAAVNDSLIEAVYHLNAQNQDLLEDVQQLRALVNQLRSQLRRTPTAETLPTQSAGGPEQLNTASSDRGGACE